MTICMDCPDAIFETAVLGRLTLRDGRITRPGGVVHARTHPDDHRQKPPFGTSTHTGIYPTLSICCDTRVRKPKPLKKQTYQLRVDDLPVFGLVEVAGLEEVVDALLRSRHPHRAHRPPNNERALDRLVVVLRDELVHDLLDTPLR